MKLSLFNWMVLALVGMTVLVVAVEPDHSDTKVHAVHPVTNGVGAIHPVSKGEGTIHPGVEIHSSESNLHTTTPITNGSKKPQPFGKQPLSKNSTHSSHSNDTLLTPIECSDTVDSCGIDIVTLFTKTKKWSHFFKGWIQQRNKHCQPNGSHWQTKQKIQCYQTPTLHYWAKSPAKALAYEGKGACDGSPTPIGFPTSPDYKNGNWMAIPRGYLQNQYDRRCFTRAMVRVPCEKSDQQGCVQGTTWMSTWVVDHNLGTYDVGGKPTNDSIGILLSYNIYNRLLQGKPDSGTLGYPVQWFFTDLNTV